MSSNEISLAGSSSANHGSNGVDSSAPVNETMCLVQKELAAGELSEYYTEDQLSSFQNVEKACKESRQLVHLFGTGIIEPPAKKDIMKLITRLNKRVNSSTDASRHLEQLTETVTSEDIGGNGKVGLNIRARQKMEEALETRKKVLDEIHKLKTDLVGFSTPAGKKSAMIRLEDLSWEVFMVDSENLDTAGIIAEC